MSQKITETVEQLVLPILEDKELQLIDIQFKKEGSQWFLRVYIDKAGGVDIEDCGLVSEALSTELDQHDPIPQAYFLEVSSPGAERPLKKAVDISASIGKYVHISLYEPVEEQKTFEGKLIAFDGEQLTIEIKIKTRVKKISIPYTKVAKARLAVVF